MTGLDMFICWSISIIFIVFIVLVIKKQSEKIEDRIDKKIEDEKNEKLAKWHDATICSKCKKINEEYSYLTFFKYDTTICPHCGNHHNLVITTRVVDGKREVLGYKKETTYEN